MTVFNGQPWDVIPESITRAHLENLISIEPDVVAISNGTTKVSESEAFIEFLLSPNGQALWIENQFLPLPVSHSAFEVTETSIDETIYSEFNWTSRVRGYGPSSIFTEESVVLTVYLRSSILETRSNLTHCWSNIVNAYRNGSIDALQLSNFSSELGEPLTFLCPISGENETFTRDYAISILYSIYTEPYASQLYNGWRAAANLRYETIFNELSVLL
jgi:hypothetical protein